MDPPARILLVEDEAITALAVARQLRRLGYQVVAHARSGPQAIQHAFALHPHVVLMDINLHGPMDGIDAARHIQAVAPIPIVYMSAHADAATVERIQTTAQAAGLVPKPLHLPTLHLLLQQALSAFDVPGKRNAPGATAQGRGELDSRCSRVDRNSADII